MIRILAILLLLSTAVGCRDADEADPDPTGNQDATSDQRERPDAVEQDETEDSRIADQTEPDSTPDTVEDTTPDTVEDTTPDTVEDTTPDTVEDPNTDTAEDQSEDLAEDGTSDPDAAEVDSADTSDASDVADTTDADSTDDPDVTTDVADDGSELGTAAFIIVEIGGNPQAAPEAPLTDAQGEFIEVYNNTDGPLPLAGLVFAYTEWTGGTVPTTSDERVVVTSDYTVPAHSLAVLGRTNLPSVTGVTPDGIYSATAEIFNGTGASSTRARIRLLSADSDSETANLLDEVLIPVGTFSNDNRGRTWQLSFTDGDSPVPVSDRSASNWCSTPAVEGNVFRENNWGTPGAANLVCD